MKKKVHCGRLVMNRDGTVKRLQLSDGGGTRDCIWDSIDMSFDEILESLCKLFQVDAKKEHPQLFDFRQQPLDKNRFSSFFDYVNVNGLKFNGTLLYLCTSSDRSENEKISPVPDTRPIASSSSSIPASRAAQAEADSSSMPLLIKIDRTSPDVEERPPPPPLEIISVPSRSNDRPEKRTRSPSNSFSNYSFDRSLNELIQNLRRILVEHRHEAVFVQLFEEFSTLNGLSSLILDRLKNEMEKKSKIESDSIYNDALDKIERLNRTIKATIELNKMKISRIDGTPTLIREFDQFQEHFNKLQSIWRNFFQRRSRETVKVYSVERTPPRKVHSVSKTSRPSSTSVRKEKQPTRKSEIKATRRTRIGSNLFQTFLTNIGILSSYTRRHRLSPFHDLIGTLISEVRKVRSEFNSRKESSINETERTMISVERRLREKLIELNRTLAPERVNPDLERLSQKTIDSANEICRSIDRSRRNSRPMERTPRVPRWSTPPSSSSNFQPTPINHDVKPNISSAPVKTRFEDDQSSEASNSSCPDEELLKVAKDSFEKRI